MPKQLRNATIKERLANFELKEKDGFIEPDVLREVCVKMPDFVSREIEAAFDTHFRVAQYAEYNPRTNPSPDMGAGNTLLNWGLQYLDISEDACAEECDCDNPGQLLQLGLGIVVGGVAGVLAASGFLLTNNAGLGLALPAGIEYISAVGTVIKNINYEPRPQIGISTSVGDYISYPFTEVVWGDLIPGEPRIMETWFKHIGSGIRRIDSVFTSANLGMTSYYRFEPAGAVPPPGAAIVEIL